MIRNTKPIAFITGSSRGIGKACALRLAQDGFNVVIHGTESSASTERLEKLKAELETLGSDVLIVQGSVDDRRFRDGVFPQILEHFGRLDCVINNAGTASLRRGDLLELEEDSYDHCNNINTKALFFMCQNAARILLDQEPLPGFGLSIINVTSCSAAILSPSRGDYCISKAGASMTTQLFALRLAPTKVRVFEIRPGIIQTDMTSVVHEKYDLLIADGLVPEQRWGLPEDIAAAASAMAKGSLPFTVGQIVNVDGGLNIRNF